MNDITSTGERSEKPDRAMKTNNDNEIPLAIKDDSKIQSIVSAHRDEALSIFNTDAPASRMVCLRMKNLGAMKSSMSLSVLPSKLPTSLPSAFLQGLLVTSEDEALALFQILREHRDKASEMFKAGVSALRMISMRMENLSAMNSAMAFSPTLPATLKRLLVKSEDEAMMEFQKEIISSPSSEGSPNAMVQPSKKVQENASLPSNEDSPNTMIGFSERNTIPTKVLGMREDSRVYRPANNFENDRDANNLFEKEETNATQVYDDTESKNQDLMEHELFPCSDKSRSKDPVNEGSPNEGTLVAIDTNVNNHPMICSPEDDVENLEPSKQNSKTQSQSVQRAGKYNWLPSSSSDDNSSCEKNSGGSGGDAGLSEYESYLRNVKNDQTRAHLETIANNNIATPSIVAEGASNSAATALLASSNTVDTKHPQKKEIVPVPGKSLLRRRCHSKRKRGFGISLPTAKVSKNDVSVNTVNNPKDFPMSIRFDLIGANFHKRKKVYEARLAYQDERHYFGTYKLQSDAALAHDMAVKMLYGPARKHEGQLIAVNFMTQQDHIDMREYEMRLTGLDVELGDTLAKISRKVNQVESKITKPKGTTKEVSMKVKEKHSSVGPEPTASKHKSPGANLEGTLANGEEEEAASSSNGEGGEVEEKTPVSGGNKGEDEEGGMAIPGCQGGEQKKDTAMRPCFQAKEDVFAWDEEEGIAIPGCRGGEQKKDTAMRPCFQAKEDVFAWDRHILYKARVIGTREDKQHGWKYHVHYMGYSKGQRQWLTSATILKDTPENRDYFAKSRGW